MEVDMKWKFDTVMVFGIKDGYQPSTAVQESGRQRCLGGQQVAS